MTINKYVRSFAGLATAAMLLMSGTSYAAGSASFSVTPTSVTTGSDTTVSFYENGDNVSTVTATFTYDSSKLQFVGSSCGGAFPNVISAGSASVTCYINPGSAPVSGMQKFASATFKATTVGSAAVTITGSQIASNGTNAWNGSPASGSVTIAAPAPAQSNTSSSGGTASNSNGASNTKSSGAGSKSSTTTAPADASTSGGATDPTATTPATQTSNNSRVKGGSTKASSKPAKSGAQFRFTTTELMSTATVVVLIIAISMGYLLGNGKLPKYAKRVAQTAKFF